MVIKKLFTDLVLDKEVLEQRSFFQKSPLFKNITNDEFSKIFKIIYHKFYDHGETVFEESQTGKAIFFIYSGEVGIFKKGKHETHVATLAEGDFIGETALVEECPRSITARTMTATNMYIIYKSHFDDLIHAHPRMGLKIVLNLTEILNTRLQAATQKLANK